MGKRLNATRGSRYRASSTSTLNPSFTGFIFDASHSSVPDGPVKPCAASRVAKTPSAAVAASPMAFIILIAPLLTTKLVKPRAPEIPTAFAMASLGSPQILPAIRGIPYEAAHKGWKPRSMKEMASLTRMLDLVKASIEERLPYGMGVTRLCELPAEWSRQYRVLGLTAPNC